MHKIRLLLLDDHILFREGLTRLLATEEEFEIVAQCGTTSEAVNLLESHAIDLVLLDFDLGYDTGLCFISSAAAARSTSKILLVTAGLSAADSEMVWNQGISGVFLKHGSPATLLQAIRAVAAGRKWIDLKVAPPSPTQSRLDEPKVGEILTSREQQVLRCVFEGLINKQIAARIGISQSSVKATLQHLFEKTGVRTRSQLVRFAIERSLETDKR
ncbi:MULTISPECIES: response regulator transcription factor [Acidobacteriaceae]|uniref:response regulator transcription factor n=1 Tax=Acidobacteriaceae TaxID=204434 RepID=UPI00131AAFF4|nr:MULTISPECIES: response regulator transcription factor [Acidobacteriaceae]MDW5264680.1 response regulator transcription factor [Edaphobacter sp.]